MVPTTVYTIVIIEFDNTFSLRDKGHSKLDIKYEINNKNTIILNMNIPHKPILLYCMAKTIE